MFEVALVTLGTVGPLTSNDGPTPEVFRAGSTGEIRSTPADAESPLFPFGFAESRTVEEDLKSLSSVAIVRAAVVELSVVELETIKLSVIESSVAGL